MTPADLLAVAHRVLLDVGDDGLAPHTRKDAHALALFIVDLLEDDELTMVPAAAETAVRRLRDVLRLDVAMAWDCVNPECDEGLVEDGDCPTCKRPITRPCSHPAALHGFRRAP